MEDRKLTDLNLLSLFVGGADGSKRQDAASAFTGECDMIKILADSTSFTVLTAVDQNGDAVNMLTANNLTSKTWDKGDLVFAPGGGYISAYTSAAETEPYTMMNSDRTKQTS